MATVSGLSFVTVLLYVFLVASQVLAVSLLPQTQGFTNLGWTLACLATYSLSMWSLAYIIHTGIPMSVMIPVLSAVVPLAAITVGILVFKEAASATKIVLLCVACGFIAAANVVK